VLHGGHRAKSVKTLLQSAKKRIARRPPDNIVKVGQSGFGGHFRACKTSATTAARVALRRTLRKLARPTFSTNAHGRTTRRHQEPK
jgi:hypothetical protein